MEAQEGAQGEQAQKESSDPVSSLSAPMYEFTWVTDVATLLKVAEDINAAAWVAIDTESNTQFAYADKICLIQINAENKLYLVDTLALPRSDPDVIKGLKAILEKEGRVCYLHGGENDVAHFKRDYGINLTGLMDTQQGAKFLGWKQTNYGALVERTCGVHLPKQYGIYDWATRPIEGEPLRYALDDVVWLPQVAKEIERLVREHDLEEEFALANLAVAQSTHSELSLAQNDEGGSSPLKIYAIKGAGSLSKPELRVLLLLFIWRDKEALKHNTAPANILLNHKLIQIAKATSIQIDPKPVESENLSTTTITTTTTATTTTLVNSTHEEQEKGEVKGDGVNNNSPSEEGDIKSECEVTIVTSNCETTKKTDNGTQTEPLVSVVEKDCEDKEGQGNKEEKEKEKAEVTTTEKEKETDTEKEKEEVKAPGAEEASLRVPHVRALAAKKKGGRRRRSKGGTPQTDPSSPQKQKSTHQPLKGRDPLSAEEMEALKAHVLRILGHDQGYFADVMSCIEEAWKNPPRLPKKNKDKTRGLPLLKKGVEETKEEFAGRVKKQREDIKFREMALKKWRAQEAVRRGVPVQVVLPIKALNHLRLYGMHAVEEGQEFRWEEVPQFGAKRGRIYGDMLKKICEDPFIIEGVERKEEGEEHVLEDEEEGPASPMKTKQKKKETKKDQDHVDGQSDLPSYATEKGK